VAGNARASLRGVEHELPNQRPDEPHSDPGMSDPFRSAVGYAWFHDFAMAYKQGDARESKIGLSYL